MGKEITYTVYIEQVEKGGVIGYIEEIPNLIQVKGDTITQVKYALRLQLAYMVIEMNDVRSVNIKTSLNVRRNRLGMD